ncbi:MAG: M23 family metallopeptidase [Pyrinomonadaceae bacterium]
MAVIRNAFLLFTFLTAGFGCSERSAQANNPFPTPTPTQISPKTIADSFAYPIGKTETVTQAKDKDEWYNALDFGADDHLGEDWNKNTGGNTDCGESVFAAANGVITYAEDAGPGWGNVVIIEHTLKNGEKVQTLYAHMLEILKTSGEIKKRDQIGKVGNANGRYYCHLHFELRSSDSRDWNKAGGGYSTDRKGWLDPSDFIDKKRANP